MKSYYLNSDLVIISKSSLTSLAEAVKGKARLLHCGKHGTKWHASFEANGSGHPGRRTPADDILRLLNVFSNLKGSTALLWKGCISREMNIGWQSSDKRPEGSFQLDPVILLELAKQKVVLGITVYPYCSDEAERIGITQLQSSG